MATEIESDADAVFRLLYTWAVGDSDPKIGRHTVKTQELVDSTGLSDERIEDAVTLLEDSGYLEAHTGVVGLQAVVPTTHGRARFQQISAGRVSDATGDASDVVEYDVFLSHSSYDDKLAEEVKQLLEHNGIRTFATPLSIIKGKWEDQIETALRRSANIWVLLTKVAVEESVWTHQELGYFYGFRHGQGQDPRGELCRFLFTQGTFPPGTPLPGLYGHFQGTSVDSFDDAAVVAEKIAMAMGRSFQFPPDYQRRSDASGSQWAINHPELRLRQRRSEGHPENGTQRVPIAIRVSEPIFNLGVKGTPSNLVSVSLMQPVPQVANLGKFVLQIAWKGIHRDAAPPSLPADVRDSHGRLFRVDERPNDPGSGDLIVFSFDTEVGTSVGAVTYFSVEPHQKEFPDFQLVSGGAPFGWLVLSQPNCWQDRDGEA